MARSARGAVAFAKLAAKPQGLGEGAWPCLEGGSTRPAMGRSLGSAADSAASPATAWGSAAARCPGCARRGRRRIRGSRQPIPGLNLGHVPACAPGTRALVWEGHAMRPDPAKPNSKSLAFDRELSALGHPHGSLSSGPCSESFSVPTRRVRDLGSSPIPFPERRAPGRGLPVPDPTERGVGLHSRLPCLSAGMAEGRAGGRGGDKNERRGTWPRAGTRGPFSGFRWSE